MKTLIMLLVLLTTATQGFCRSGYRQESIGDYDYRYYKDGTKSTSYNIGSHGYTDYSDGSKSHTYYVGDVEYTDFY